MVILVETKRHGIGTVAERFTTSFTGREIDTGPGMSLTHCPSKRPHLLTLPKLFH